jgi:hypothetical protein
LPAARNRSTGARKPTDLVEPGSDLLVDPATDRRIGERGAEIKASSRNATNPCATTWPLQEWLPHVRPNEVELHHPWRFVRIRCRAAGHRLAAGADRAISSATAATIRQSDLTENPHYSRTSSRKTSAHPLCSGRGLSTHPKRVSPIGAFSLSDVDCLDDAAPRCDKWAPGQFGSRTREVRPSQLPGGLVTLHLDPREDVLARRMSAAPPAPVPLPHHRS